MKGDKIKRFALVGILFLLGGCTTYEGAAYLKNDLDKMDCTISQAPKAHTDFKKAKNDCIKSTVDDEYFKGGVSEATLDWIKEVQRRTYRDCMSQKGFSCSWKYNNN